MTVLTSLSPVAKIPLGTQAPSRRLVSVQIGQSGSCCAIVSHVCRSCLMLVFGSFANRATSKVCFSARITRYRRTRTCFLKPSKNSRFESKVPAAGKYTAQKAFLNELNPLAPQPQRQINFLQYRQRLPPKNDFFVGEPRAHVRAQL